MAGKIDDRHDLGQHGDGHAGEAAEEAREQGSTTRYGMSTTESGNVSPAMTPTTRVSAVNVTKVVRRIA